LKHYSHFTSPIRRAPDFIIHQIIKEKLQGKLDAKRIAHYNGSLEEIANRCSEKERAAERLEYKIRDYFMVQFYKEKIGQEFDGMIS
jgi:ribonuclease R